MMRNPNEEEFEKAMGLLRSAELTRMEADLYSMRLREVCAVPPWAKLTTRGIWVDEKGVPLTKDGMRQALADAAEAVGSG